MSRIANMITASRLVLALVISMIFLAGNNLAGDAPLKAVILPLFLLAAFTDLLDGWVARRMHSATEFGATLDSLADYVFYGSTPFWIWWSVTPALWDAIVLPLVILGCVTLLTLAAKISSRTKRFLHLWSAKTAAFGVFVASFLLIGGWGEAWMVWAGVSLIIIAELEEMALLAGINVHSNNKVGQ